jgi:AmmeMemoRadiSam system protein B
MRNPVWIGEQFAFSCVLFLFLGAVVHAAAPFYPPIFFNSAQAAAAPLRSDSFADPGPVPMVRAQLDTIGFAATWRDMEAVLEASRQREEQAVTGRRRELGLAAEDGWIAAVMPHDDYLYAGPVDLHLLPGLKADRWLIVGVCHACRRLGLRDRLIFDGFAAWRVAGKEIPVDVGLRERLLARLDSTEAYVDNARHAAEHSVESLLPWIHAVAPRASFVPVLVPGMSWPRMQALAERLAVVLATICRQEEWSPGQDVGVLISADAVHYGCEGWGDKGGYFPFGCDEPGHAAAVTQDITLAEATLAGRVTDDGLARFASLVWDPARPEYPYRITWCGLYSIPFGLAVSHRLQTALDLPPLFGYLLRYGDSVSDGRLAVPNTRLGVTAPNTIQHWVGYPALGYIGAR